MCTWMFRRRDHKNSCRISLFMRGDRLPHLRTENTVVDASEGRFMGMTLLTEGGLLPNNVHFVLVDVMCMGVCL